MPDHKVLRRYHTSGDLHELTFSSYRQMPLLTNDPWRVELSRCLDAAIDEARFNLVAFVFMPDHVHLLVGLGAKSEASEVSRFLARLKQPFSKKLKSLLPADSHCGAS